MKTPAPIVPWFDEEPSAPTEKPPAGPSTIEVVEAEVVEAGVVTDLLDGESSRRVTHSFKRLRRSAGAKRHPGKQKSGKQRKSRMASTPMSTRDAGSDAMTPQDPPAEGEAIGEVNGSILAEYILGEIQRLARFLETEEGKTRRKGHTDLDVLEKMMNEGEALDLILRFEQRARRLLESGAQEEEALLLGIAERALHVLEDQARNHSVGGVDMNRHKSVREELRAALMTAKRREAVRSQNAIGGPGGDDSARLGGQGTALLGSGGHD